jgi:DNA helicase-2/ATP-dependent DNA helicase PcrA
MAAEVLAGPAVLGRSVLLDPDDDIPPPWQNAEELAAHRDVSPDVVEELHRAWRERRALIIRWSGPLPDDSPRLSKPFYELGVDEELPGERLRFAVTANAVNLLGSDPGFAPLTDALSIGGTINGSTDGAEPELITPNGTAVWSDGGPLDLDLPAAVDAPIVPRVHLAMGSLRSVGPRTEATAELAPDQLAAVAHRSGPARILAPAGSGKTRVLTERVRHLVGDCGLEARAVSLVAYNRRAKDEMRDRLQDVPALDIRTLNSLALAIATSSGPFHAAGNGGQRQSTINEMDVRRLLDRVVPGRRRKKLTDPLEPWVDALSACRLGLRDPHEVEGAYGGDIAGFPDVIAAYRQELARGNVLDFDEQIIRAIDRLLDDPQARRIARSVAPVLLVDEFQDLTPAHLLLLRIIAGPAGEIFGVGDDDQTIYGYAGASPDWLIDYPSFFPGAVDHRLTVNYRCPPQVVDAAVNLLSYNRQRVAKTITAGNADDTTSGADAKGAGLAIFGSGDPQQNLTDHVTSLMSAGAAPRDVAVLARVNAALLPAAVFLNAAGVPVARPFGLGGDVLDRSGVGAALSWLRLATGPAQALRGDDLRLALRRPPRSLHPRVSDWVCEQPSVKQLLALSQRLNKEREAESVAEFAADIASLREAIDDDATTEDVLHMIFEEIGLLGAASQLDRSQRSARRAAHADELAALSAVATLHEDPTTFESWLRSSLDDIPVFDPEQPADTVTLATVHTTKGLEWPHVIVHDVRDGLYPHRLADDIEEERRIFHVAVTRGRESVAVTVSGPPSPFVAELGTARPADEPWPTVDTGGAGGSGTGTGSAKLVTSASAPKERAVPTSEAAGALRELLTEFRRDRCKADGVPAYVVLDNKTLDAIAEAAPTTLGELGNISGIGPAKLERYGADILGIIASAD